MEVCWSAEAAVSRWLNIGLPSVEKRLHTAGMPEVQRHQTATILQSPEASGWIGPAFKNFMD
ncbi:hypothetical protein GCM10010970_21140 [Silvimonas iriomotensis]|uniref:Uncharacterized protein n=1 Tax=Silvimonas iriomotensis TaxID=449662 RepID=A0ABQ2P9C0_9NEIS|nr:hypothetical protein GCM10010970_21140 [Silvimonas iriomotensis]